MGKDYRTQLHFYEDHSFDFVKRELWCSCLVERSGEKLVRAWKHFYGCELAFPGYKKTPSTLVTLGFGRDIILDLFNKVPTTSTGEVTKKPTAANIKEWIAQIATNMRQLYRSKRENTTLTNLITWVLLGILMFQSLTWLVIWARQNYGG